MSETQAEQGTLTVAASGPLAHIFDPEKFAQTWRVACSIAASTLLPDHLRLNMKTKQPLDAKQVESNILRIVNQAIRWNVDPYAIVDCTYVVANKLGYEGKLVAGVVNARAGLVERLAYTFTGSGNDRTVTVSGTFQGETEPRTIELSVGQAKTSNKMWTSDPDQKLVYSGATKWARRHCPEIMLGVLTDQDLEVMRENSPTITTLSVTADKPTLSEKINAKAPVEPDSDPVTTAGNTHGQCTDAEAAHAHEASKVPPSERLPLSKADDTPPVAVLDAEPDAESGDIIDLRMRDFEEAYQAAKTVADIDALDAKAGSDPVVAAREYQQKILGKDGFSAKARRG